MPNCYMQIKYHHHNNNNNDKVYEAQIPISRYTQGALQINFNY